MIKNKFFKDKSLNFISFSEKYIEYLGTYILPFIALQTNDIFDTAAFILMFLTLGYIYVKTNLIYTNPTLSFFKFDIIKIVTEDNLEYDCLTKDNIEIGNQPTGSKLAKNTYIIKLWTPQNSEH